jgi:hypothetical protein
MHVQMFNHGCIPKENIQRVISLIELVQFDIYD